MPQTPLDGLVIVLPLHPVQRMWLSLRWFGASALIAGIMLLAIGITIVNPAQPPSGYAGCDSWLSIKWDADCRPLLPTIEERRRLSVKHQLSRRAADDLVSLDLQQAQNRRIAEDAVRARMGYFDLLASGSIVHQTAYRITFVAAPVGLIAALLAMAVALVRMRFTTTITVTITEQHVALGGQRYAIDSLRGCGVFRQRLVLYTDDGEVVRSPRLSASPAALRDVRRRIRALLPEAPDLSRRVLHRALRPILERSR